MRRSVTCIVVVSLFAVACGGPDKPPEVATVEATDAGAIAPMPDKPGSGSSPKPSSDDGKSARGPKASTFSLPSLTTPGKVEIPPGKVVIVDFWATWCEPCKKSFPKLQELYVKYKASGLEIAAVSVDDEKRGIAAFAKTYGAKFPIGWDDGHKVAEEWKPENMPSTYIVDKNGVVRHVHKGYHDGEIDDIERELKALL